MGLSGITFNRGQGGLGRPLPGTDYIAGMAFFIDDANLPSGFSTLVREKKIFSLADAVDLGITSDHLTETKATGKVTITGIGSNGDTIAISIAEFGGSISLGTYTKVSGDTTVTLIAVAIKAIINAGTLTHGYTADNTAGALTITARAGLGVYLNTGTPISTTIVGTMTATIVQFGASPMVAGIASAIDPLYYHISEYFRIIPKGVLYVGIYDIPGSFTFTEVGTLIDFAEGEIKQIGVYVQDDTLDAALVTTLDGVLMTKAGEDKPVSGILTVDFKSTALSALPTLASNSDYRVSVDIAQDGAGAGYTLYQAQGKTIGTMGAMLGVVSLAKVNECIGDVGQFDMSDGIELETIAFGNGAIYKTQTLSLLTILNNYKYNFLRKRAVAGSYYENSCTTIANTNDFAFIENVRTIDKAIRGIKANCEIKINSTLLLKSDGTLFDDTIADFVRLTSIGLDDMQRNQEVSAFSITMDTTQNVLSTSKVSINVVIVPTGVARQIEFNVGLSTQLN